MIHDIASMEKNDMCFQFQEHLKRQDIANLQ